MPIAIYSDLRDYPFTIASVINQYFSNI